MSTLDKMTRLNEVLSLHGRDFIFSLLVLILGALAVKWLTRWFAKLLKRITSNRSTISIAKSIFFIILLEVLIVLTADLAGIQTRPVVQLLTIIGLISIGLVIFFRPYIPELPFKVGQTIRIRDLFGKVEGTTFLNTRIRTFDGKTFYVPNQTILSDITINYHYTPSRRVKVDIPIRCDEDLLKAKQVLEEVMVGDCRVLKAPRPVVWILDINNGCIMLAGRCWSNNEHYWLTRCDLLEKAILRFKHEGIPISYPHYSLHHHGEGRAVEEFVHEGRRADENH